MNILEANFANKWRGGERQTLFNALGLKRAGNSISFICRKNSVLEKEAMSNGFNVYAFRNVLGVISFLTFKARSFDILHAQTSHILTYCVLTKPFHRAKIVFTRRIDFVPHGSKTRVKYQLADSLVAVSSAVKGIVERFTAHPVTVISDIVIERPLDRSRARRALKELHLKPETLILGTLAALVPHKDPHTLVAAIAKLAKKRKDFVFLHFGGGELYDEILHLIEKNNLTEYYKLMGFQELADDYYSLFDVFIMCSSEEGLGSSVLDAFLYKVPVVSTIAGGLEELTAGNRAVQCPIENADCICQGIIYVIENSIEVEAMVKRAYDFVTAFHSLDYITGQYVDLFSSLSSQGNLQTRHK